MKICFLANPTWSHIVKWNIYLRRQGHDVHVIFNEDDVSPDDLPQQMNVHPLRLPSFRIKLPWIIRYAFALRKIIVQIKPDVVHLHNLELEGLACILLRIKPFIVSVYGMDIVRYGQQRESSRKKYLIKRFILKKADAITAPSTYLAREVAEYGMFNQDRIIKLPFGVDTERFSPRVNKKEGRTIGILKDLRSEYGLKYFFDVINLVKNKIDNLKVIVGGDGKGRTELEEYVRVLGLNSIVTFEGKVPFENGRDFLDQLDVVVLPSLFESFGVVGLEAQSLGVPVVAVNVGGVSEIIKDGHTGYLVPPKDVNAMTDRIIELLDNNEKRVAMGQAGRQFVKDHFEWADQVEDMVHLYQNLKG